ncbi:MAG: hypothetical protein N3G21_08210 [Candidatus Hydrogenedentes bacterium]|nr:hypothetical protein [Candidatus Hydrogenedentota bacterium]
MKIKVFRVYLSVILVLVSHSFVFSEDIKAVVAYSDGRIVEVTEENRKGIFGDEKLLQKDIFISNGITFNIQYQDVNTGFNDPTWGSQRKQVLVNALGYVADVLNISGGKLDLNVSSVVIAGQFLASAGPIVVWTLPLNPGVNNGSAYQHLLNGSTDPNGPSYPDMQLTVNWNYNYYLGTGTPLSNQFDLLSVLIHEITHGIGFLTSIAYNDSQCGGNRPNGTGWTGSQPDIYTSVDTFLVTGNNNRFINSSFYFIGQGYYFTGGDNGVYINASNVVTVYGGRPRIYAPSTYQCGSSISHWNNLGGVMDPSIAPGVVRREYLPFEVALLKDIGYVNASLPTQEGEGQTEGEGGASEGEGIYEGEGEECYFIWIAPDFDNEGRGFYTELSNRLGIPTINWETTDFDGGGIPDSWEIAVLKRAIFTPKVLWRLEATCVYIHNLNLLKSEPQYDLWLRPYEHVLAGLLALNSDIQELLINQVNLINSYETIKRVEKASEELLSPYGDADYDGFNNRTEYLNCLNAGLLLNDFVEVVLNPELDGTLSPSEALSINFSVVFFVLLMLISVGIYAVYVTERDRRRDLIR